MPKKNSGGKAPTADARIVMKLYDMRREAEMRKARHFFASEFNPQTLDDVLKVVGAYGSQHNAWLRQVVGYWENAASLVLRGAVHPGLFMDWNGELIFTFAKLKPFLPELRKRFNAPEMMAQMEALLTSTAENRKKLKVTEQRMVQWAAERARAATGRA